MVLSDLPERQPPLMTVLRATEVASLVRVNVAPGTAAPLGSRTEPTIDPASICANACEARTTPSATVNSFIELSFVSGEASIPPLTGWSNRVTGADLRAPQRPQVRGILDSSGRAVMIWYLVVG